MHCPFKFFFGGVVAPSSSHLQFTPMAVSLFARTLHERNNVSFLAFSIWAPAILLDTRYTRNTESAGDGGADNNKLSVSIHTAVVARVLAYAEHSENEHKTSVLLSFYITPLNRRWIYSLTAAESVIHPRDQRLKQVYIYFITTHGVRYFHRVLHDNSLHTRYTSFTYTATKE